MYQPQRVASPERHPHGATMESMERVSCQTRGNMNSFSPGSCNYGMGRFLPRGAPFSDCMQSAGMGMSHSSGGHLGYSPYAAAAAADWNLLYHSHGLSNNSLDRQVGSALGHHHRASSHYFSMSPNVVGAAAAAGGKDYGASLHHQPVVPSSGMGVGMHGSHPSSHHSPHHHPHPAYPSPPLVPPPQHQRTQYDNGGVGYHSLCGAGPVSPQGASSCMSPDIDKKENKPKVAPYCCYQWLRTVVIRGLFTVVIKWLFTVVVRRLFTVVIRDSNSCYQKSFYCCYQWLRTVVIRDSVLLLSETPYCCYQRIHTVVIRDSVLLLSEIPYCCYQRLRTVVIRDSVLLLSVTVLHDLSPIVTV
ncbi:hypothetical protein Btru_004694 [Bulinus truncatus]|nr:hypothetical protein Btru_004694 [Bulinus truncatus]